MKALILILLDEWLTVEGEPPADLEDEEWW